MAETITLDMIRERRDSAVICDALDQHGYHGQSPRVGLRPLTCDRILVGRCRTTLWADMFHVDPRPYELELKAIDALQADDVMVAAAGGSMRSGMWGELLSTAAGNRGCVGAIVDGAVRDVRQMKQIGFPVWAAGTSPYDSRDRQRVIDIDVPVQIGGVVVSPGDLVVADEDGIVFVPRDVESDVLRAAWEKVHAENMVRDAIRDGMLASEAFARYGVL